MGVLRLGESYKVLALTFNIKKGICVLRYMVVLLFLLGCGEDLSMGEGIPSSTLMSAPCEPYVIEGMTYHRVILEGLHPTEIRDVKICAGEASTGYEHCYTSLTLNYNGVSTEILCGNLNIGLNELNGKEFTDLTVYYRESE